jgi:diguanylate cyclase (GGDEF)-like protein
MEVRHSPRWLPKLGLLGRFTLLSLTATALLGVALGHVLEHEVKRRAINNASGSAELVASFGVLPQLSYTDLQNGLSPDAIPGLDRTFLAGYQNRSVIALAVLNAKGRVVYSNLHGRIGKTVALDAALRSTLAGRAHSAVVHRIDGRPSADALIETRAPLRFGPSAGPADGVFEIYTRYAPVAADITHEKHRLYLVLAAGLLLFYTTIFRIVYSASKRLRRQSEENHHQARHDALTGLPNRSNFYEQVEGLVSGPRAPESTAVMVMDLDRFKEVNDTLGHHAGDLLLQAAARRIRRAVRDSDQVARLGGDEFAVLLPDATVETAAQVADRVQRALQERFTVSGAGVDIAASIGISLHPADASDVATLLQRADLAMYKAKESHAGHALYSPELDHGHPSQLSLLGELRQAIEREELVLHYQPKADLSTGRVTQVEALVRWQRPEHGMVPPAEFIPLAEHTGLIRQISAYVLDAALRQLKVWLDAGLDMTVAVNLSARNLVEPDLPGQIADLLLRRGVPADRLLLEITESTIMADPERAIGVLARLREMGIKLAVDDFGVGYSSLSYLKRLPVDEIKIDRSFVAAMDSQDEDAFIVRSTIDLARNLRLHVVAEGVETREVWEELGELGCDYAQGWYLGRPMPAAELPDWLSERAAA